jgi:hypothetical protein
MEVQAQAATFVQPKRPHATDRQTTDQPPDDAATTLPQSVASKDLGFVMTTQTRAHFRGLSQREEIPR